MLSGLIHHHEITKKDYLISIRLGLYTFHTIQYALCYTDLISYGSILEETAINESELISFKYKVTTHSYTPAV